VIELPPDTTLPDTTLPDTTLPDTTLPDTTLPDTALPDTEVIGLTSTTADRQVQECGVECRSRI
jgi:hypothetical protein